MKESLPLIWQGAVPAQLTVALRYNGTIATALRYIGTFKSKPCTDLARSMMEISAQALVETVVCPSGLSARGSHCRGLLIVVIADQAGRCWIRDHANQQHNPD